MSFYETAIRIIEAAVVAPAATTAAKLMIKASEDGCGRRNGWGDCRLQVTRLSWKDAAVAAKKAAPIFQICHWRVRLGLTVREFVIFKVSEWLPSTQISGTTQSKLRENCRKSQSLLTKDLDIIICCGNCLFGRQTVPTAMRRE